MMKTTVHERFKIRSLEELSELSFELGVDVPVSEDMSVLLSETTVAGRKLKNRIVSLPMEGIDADENGAPSDYTYRKYNRLSAGGSAMLWLEACAVTPEGRSNPRQLLINPENVDHYKRFVDEIKATSRAVDGKDVVMVLQLTHSGRFSKPDGTPSPLFAQRNPVLDLHQSLKDEDQPVTDDYLERLLDSFVEASKLAEQAGFDGVDMKAVHGYLIAELLGARQRENSRFGGSYENRTRFIKEAFVRMNQELKSSFVCSRFTTYEPSVYPYGWGVEAMEGSSEMDLSEPIRLLGELEELGLPLTGLSIGYPRTQPHWNRPYDMGLVGASPPPEHPLVGVARFIRITREVHQAVPGLNLTSAGSGWLRQFAPNVGAAQIECGDTKLFGMGRGLLAYPDMPRDLEREGVVNRRKCCVTCSKCSQIMADVICRSGCVVRDQKYYKDEYMTGRANAQNFKKY